MSNRRRLMPPLNERQTSTEPVRLMTAHMASGELGGNTGTFWDRIGISKTLMVAGQEKAGCSWLTSTTSPDK